VPLWCSQLCSATVELLPWNFDLHFVPSTHSAVNAHVHFVAASIRVIARSSREGLQM